MTARGESFHSGVLEHIPTRLLAVPAWLFLTSAFRFLPSRATRGIKDSFYFYYYSLIQSLIEEKQQEPTCKAIKVIRGSSELTCSSTHVTAPAEQQRRCSLRSLCPHTLLLHQAPQCDEFMADTKPTHNS